MCISEERSFTVQRSHVIIHIFRAASHRQTCRAAPLALCSQPFFQNLDAVATHPTFPSQKKQISSSIFLLAHSLPRLLATPPSSARWRSNCGRSSGSLVKQPSTIRSLQIPAEQDDGIWPVVSKKTQQLVSSEPNTCGGIQSVLHDSWSKSSPHF